MDISQVLNTKGGVAASAEFQQHLGENSHRLSDTGSERGMSPHMSDHISKYAVHQPLHSLSNMPHAPFQHMAHMQHMQNMAQLQPSSFPVGARSENGYVQPKTEDHSMVNQNATSTGPVETPVQVKAFACTTCSKGFARRSDLARHERIHSGVRPHVCEVPGCGKQFIQRSALTVHARVHTGEKPHMCEHCTKPFSDSSSLARHRRIHSGKRPYKCPYADCQKTFTRRTTLTRHQNHHTGTVEESARATAAALASRPSSNTQKTRSDGGTYSETASARSTPSPARQNMSMSPAGEMPHMSLARQQSDYGYQYGSLPLPPHMRGDIPHSPHASPGSTSPSLSQFGPPMHRPSLTSHPNHNAYGPPQTLEPAAQSEQRTSGSAGGSQSPHMSTVGWHSPTQGAMIAPSHGGYPVYPDPNNFTFNQPQQYLYHNTDSNMRRPQSTEPDQYETKPRIMQDGIW